MSFTIGGMVVALGGAWIGSTIPFAKMMDVYGDYRQAVNESDWPKMQKMCKRKALPANILLVLGTALQIYGTKIG